MAKVEKHVLDLSANLGRDERRVSASQAARRSASCMVHDRRVPFPILTSMQMSTSRSILALAMATFLVSIGARADDDGLPRLSGIVFGPPSTAIFARPDGSSLVVGEGEKVGAYTIETIRPAGVVVFGPDGARLSELAPEARPGSRSVAPSQPTALGEVAAGGLTIGRLAIQRDNCVRRGLLPGARIDAERRVRELLQLIAGAPPPRDAGTTAAPQAIAAATSAGLDSARRSAVVVLTTKEACRRLDTTWQRQAARFGLR